MNGTISCAEARAMDLINYLYGLGYNPERIRGNEYWYLSPFRSEKDASFKVDRGRNIWYDHGIGSGGTLIDFGLQYHGCSLQALLDILGKAKGQHFSFHLPISPGQNAPQKNENRLEIIRSEQLTNHSLLSYFLSRGITIKTARKYLEQVTYQVRDHQFMALGFRNNSGGYELRSPSFKGSSSPKDSTLIQGDKNSATLAVFEGVFSFLSYLELKEKTPASLVKTGADYDMIFEKSEPNFLVLNSLSFFVKRKETMEIYPTINLYLDRDKAGMEATQKALQWSSKYKDKSSLYKGHKDVNDYLVHCLKQSPSQEQRKNNGRKKSL